MNAYFCVYSGSLKTSTGAKTEKELQYYKGEAGMKKSYDIDEVIEAMGDIKCVQGIKDKDPFLILEDLDIDPEDLEENIFEHYPD